MKSSQHKSKDSLVSSQKAQTVSKKSGLQNPTPKQKSKTVSKASIGRTSQELDESEDNYGEDEFDHLSP